MDDLNYSSFGRRNRPAVLLLHGFMGDMTDWSSVIASLERDYFCIAVDLPGHGGSHSLDDPEAYTMPGAAQRLGRVLDKLQIPRCVLVGYSMGGRLALYFALHHEDRCSRLIMESTTPGLQGRRERMERIAVDEQRADSLESGNFDAFLEEWYRQPLFASLAQHEELRERMIDKRKHNDPKSLARVLRGLGTGSQLPLWGALACLHIPALALAGALDAKYVEIGNCMALLNGCVRLQIVQSAGHNIHAEQPSAYVDAIQDFLREL